MPTSVVIRGVGLTSALGIGVDACMAQMNAGPAEPVSWEISNLDERIAPPIYRIPGADDLTDVSRASCIIEQAVLEAVAAAGLSKLECQTLPIFIGLSAFSLDRDAMAPDARQGRIVVGAQPVLGHQQAVEIVQRCVGSRGETFAFQTACTSSANATIAAARMIRLGWFKRALVVGVELANFATMAGFSSLQLISASIKPFDRDRTGIVLGEGVGAIVLGEAPADAAGVHIREGGSNIDVYRVTMSNPDGSSIASLEQSVLRRVGIRPEEIVAIKAHGTGSSMNDASEAAALHRVFSTIPPVCAIKPYLGHTLGGCGVNETILMSSLLQAGVFPATPGFQTVDPALGITPTTVPITAPDGFYLLHYFGFGGHNTVIVLENRS